MRTHALSVSQIGVSGTSAGDLVGGNISVWGIVVGGGGGSLLIHAVDKIIMLIRIPIWNQVLVLIDNWNTNSFPDSNDFQSTSFASTMNKTD
jgi:hypothetical protein